MKKHKGTFIVKVDNYQNGTWQGCVTWAEENITEHFRSSLELIKLIDEAVNSGAIYQQIPGDNVSAG
jgi:hypothetical protein